MKLDESSIGVTNIGDLQETLQPDPEAPVSAADVKPGTTSSDTEVDPGMATAVYMSTGLLAVGSTIMEWRNEM